MLHRLAGCSPVLVIRRNSVDEDSEEYSGHPPAASVGIREHNLSSNVAPVGIDVEVLLSGTSDANPRDFTNTLPVGTQNFGGDVPPQGLRRTLRKNAGQHPTQERYRAEHEAPGDDFLGV